MEHNKNRNRKISLGFGLSGSIFLILYVLSTYFGLFSYRTTLSLTSSNASASGLGYSFGVITIASPYSVPFLLIFIISYALMIVFQILS